MLKVVIPETEFFDEKLCEFITIKETTLQLEHSLVSIAKWESKWHKSFLDTKDKTVEETLDYIRCMTITQNVNPLVYRALTADIMKTINSYIDDPMTATTFKQNGKHGQGGSFTTAELIYYWMIVNDIPVEFEKWHLNRLLTLIRICGEKNSSGDRKMKKRDILAQNKALNDARRKSAGIRG